MGLDLVALDKLKRRKSGYGNYVHLSWGGMAELVDIMRTAGVRDERILRKFEFNDELVVTPRQCGTLAKRLAAWLEREAATADPDLVDLAEDFVLLCARAADRYGFVVE